MSLELDRRRALLAAALGFLQRPPTEAADRRWTDRVPDRVLTF